MGGGFEGGGLGLRTSHHFGCFLYLPSKRGILVRERETDDVRERKNMKDNFVI